MVKLLGSFSLVGLGIFVTITPKFSGRGGTTDLSFMHLNVFLGFTLVSIGILLFKSDRKKK